MGCLKRLEYRYLKGFSIFTEQPRNPKETGSDDSLYATVFHVERGWFIMEKRLVRLQGRRNNLATQVRNRHHESGK